MPSIRTFVALTGVVFITACAAPHEPGGPHRGAGRQAEHASHHPAGAASAPASAMPDRMKAMREMHDKMMNAKTPEEKQALMADHMKAMQDGMHMMKGMGGGMGARHGMGPMGGMGAKGSPDDMAQRQKMMEERMDMMQMMMDMMMQRMPASGVPPAAK